MKRRRAQQAMVKPAVAILLVLLLIIGVSWASCRKKKAAQTSAVQLTTDVIISEIMINNTGIVSDGAGNHPDYVELHNISAQNQDISGWGLSDREDRLWVFPDKTVLPPDGYILVWCTGEKVENALIGRGGRDPAHQRGRRAPVHHGDPLRLHRLHPELERRDPPV